MVSQCSGVGVSRVEVLVLGRDMTVCDGVFDQREYPCRPSAFAAGQPVDGPTLEPGEYTLLVRGLRRTGEAWRCPIDIPVEENLIEDGEVVLDKDGNPVKTLVCEEAEDPEDTPSCLVRELVDVTIGEDGQLTMIDGAAVSIDDPAPVEVVLVAPPQCDDGIDNDLDGKVDGKDPGCLVPPAVGATADSESAENGVALFRPSVSFLDNEAVKPFNVGVDYVLLEVEVEVEVEGQPGTQTQWIEFAEIADWELDLGEWPFGVPLLSFDPGLYDALNTEFPGRATALGASHQALTQAIDFSFTVNEEQVGFVTDHFDFTGDRFIDPIVAPLRLSLGLRLGADDISVCELNGYGDLDDDGLVDDPIALERVWVRVRDADDQLLDAATLALTGNAYAGGMITPVDEADGWVSFECPASNVTSAPLQWGSYRIEIDGRIAGESCFALPELDNGTAQGLAPQPVDAQELYLDRLPEGGGAPPAACTECNLLNIDEVGAKRCDGANVCEDGICVNKVPTGG